jgi:protein-tyrosine phosphatase
MSQQASAEVPTMCNLREVIGSTDDGRCLRSGLLFRSDAPDLRRPADTRLLRTRGVRILIDLRSQAEAEGTALRAQDLECICARVEPVDWADRTLPPGQFASYLAGRYLELAERGLTGSKPIGRALTALLRPVRTPRLVCCAGGKDRTGLVVAIALSLLGITAEHIADDYTRSSAAAVILAERARRSAAKAPGAVRTAHERRHALREAANGSVAANRPLVNPAPRQAVTSFLDRLTESFAGVQRYAALAGVDAELIRQAAGTLLI